MKRSIQALSSGVEMARVSWQEFLAAEARLLNSIEYRNARDKVKSDIKMLIQGSKDVCE